MTAHEDNSNLNKEDLRLKYRDKCRSSHSPTPTLLNSANANNNNNIFSANNSKSGMKVNN